MVRGYEPAGLAKRVGGLVPLTGLSVLAVDDHEVGRSLLEAMVAGTGADIEVVGSAEEAMLAAAQRRYDVVLVDLGLPDRPGDRLAEEIARLPTMRGVPIVAVTGRDRPPVVPPMFVDWMTKPYGVRDLYRLLAGVSGRAGL